MVSGRKNPLFFGLALRLKQARKLAGLKRLPLAEKAGLATATGRDIETGQRLPTVATVARLAAALDVSAGWLGYGLGESTTDGPPATCDGMGARLTAVRVEQGHARAELARLTDLSPRAIAKIEAGGQSGVEVIESLAQALGVSPGWLAFGTGPQVLPLRRRGRPPAQDPSPDPAA
jgi:transcriptional regulator with XRE-family HTH domain